MPYLIDSDILIDHLEAVPEITALVARLASAGIAISIISYMEAYQGILRSPDRSRAEASFEAFLAAAPVVPFSPAVARRCALLREELRRQGKQPRSRAMDLMIAATAIENGLTLVTRNVGDYADIPDLILYS